jgi:molybdenum cofactor cytidylyltransferase
MEKRDGIVLAAGKSKRMGRWKMTLPLEESTVIETTVRKALTVCSRIVLVAGYRREEIEKLFSSWDRVEVVVNEQYEEGMFSSIQCGCRYVASNRFFLSLGDMPLVSPETYRVLIDSPAIPAVIPKYRGKRGHPLLMMDYVAERITGFDSRKTLHDVLAEVTTLSVPVEDRYVLHDIDTEDDYSRSLA